MRRYKRNSGNNNVEIANQLKEISEILKKPEPVMNRTLAIITLIVSILTSFLALYISFTQTKLLVTQNEIELYQNLPTFVAKTQHDENIIEYCIENVGGQIKYGLLIAYPFMEISKFKEIKISENEYALHDINEIKKYYFLLTHSLMLQDRKPSDINEQGYVINYNITTKSFEKIYMYEDNNSNDNLNLLKFEEILKNTFYDKYPEFINEDNRIGLSIRIRLYCTIEYIDYLSKHHYEEYILESIPFNNTLIPFNKTNTVSDILVSFDDFYCQQTINSIVGYIAEN